MVYFLRRNPDRAGVVKKPYLNEYLLSDQESGTSYNIGTSKSEIS